MLTVGRSFRPSQFVDLKRTVDVLNGQLREAQGELYRIKAEPLFVWLWRNLMSVKGRQEFMSTVCNRRVRPNTRMVLHADPRA
jgi:hypothetical protein